MAELKTKKTTASVTDFLKAVPDEARRKDGLALLKLFKDVTGEKPAMWGELVAGPPRKGAGPTGPSRGRPKLQQQLMGGRGIVGFGEFHYKSDKSSQQGDWPLTGFSPRKQNFTIYVMPGFKELGVLLKKLGKHKVSGGSCIYINKLSDIDTKVLGQIIKRGVATMKKKYAVT